MGKKKKSAEKDSLVEKRIEEILLHALDNNLTGQDLCRVMETVYAIRELSSRK